MEPTMQVKLLAIVKILEEVEVRKSENMVRMATAIQELRKLADEMAKDGMNKE